MESCRGGANRDVVVPVMDVVRGEFTVEHKKINQLRRKACADDMRKQN
jgi:hypothetical protein